MSVDDFFVLGLALVEVSEFGTGEADFSSVHEEPEELDLESWDISSFDSAWSSAAVSGDGDSGSG